MGKNKTREDGFEERLKTFLNQYRSNEGDWFHEDVHKLEFDLPQFVKSEKALTKSETIEAVEEMIQSSLHVCIDDTDEYDVSSDILRTELAEMKEHV